MTATLLENLESSEAAKREQAEATYTKLLTRFSAPRPGDGELMATTLETLKLNSADLARDQDARLRAADLARKILTPEQVEAARADAAAAQAKIIADAEAAVRDGAAGVLRETLDHVSQMDADRAKTLTCILLPVGDPRRETAAMALKAIDVAKGLAAEPAAVIQSGEAERALAELRRNNPRAFAAAC